MESGLSAVCDEFYVNCRLFLKMELGLQRETVLHFFDRLRRSYPTLTKLRRRDDRCLVLEEEPDERNRRRWVRLDQNSLRFGIYSPADLDEVRRFGELIFTQAPCHLTLSDIDFEHLELLYAFDLEYRGNHDQLVAETFFSDQLRGGFLDTGDNTKVIDAQPYFGIALNADCDLQAYLEVKSRTTSYEVRNEAFDGEPISIFLTLRKYWGVTEPVSLDQALATLFDHADETATEKVVPNFVNPLAAAIASRP
ncbi:MAG: hypothetical protein ACE5E5_06885 [Phycisphaerae bacterium]